MNPSLALIEEEPGTAQRTVTLWDTELLTPRGIKAELDRHVVGHGRAKVQVAIAVYYQSLAFMFARRRHPAEIRPPAPLLLVGPTGCGKTMLVEKACDLVDLAFVHVDTSTMVSEGIVGFSLGDIARAVLHASNDQLLRAEHAVVFLDEFDKVLANSHGHSVTSQILRFLEGAEIRLTPRPYEEHHYRNNLSSGSMLVFLGGAFQEVLDAKTIPATGFLGPSHSPTPQLEIADLKNAGLPKELLGRINAVLNLSALSEDDLVRVLTDSESSPLIHYRRLVGVHGDTIRIDDRAICRMAQLAHQSGLGARALKSILLKVFSPFLYISPGPERRSYHIDEELVNSLAAR